ncbi:MAG: polysaccharide deacetylase family protein [Planctomycetes bacterium]|uniref:polysaccharide deacetylase family protein n=1 Tax=Candidatus Wunengus sp. YC65 TaxID=3367701 RepID=UPI001DC73D04|nr:polysaccharide deacetylase family protein [Planctomycetota bacterium]
MSKIDEPLYVAISLDIDPDANSAVEGRHDALSSPIEYGEIRVDACKKGLQKILELLEKYDIDATLFYEARTAQMLIESGMYLPKLSERHEIACHSLKHEDFLGKVSGIPMNEKSIDESIEKAKEILVKLFGQEIKGFRAPYTRINRTVIKVLERLGFQYDSSETAILGTEWAGKPYPLEAFNSSLLELALPSFRDAKGKKMSSYLWAIFEGRRIFSEYIDAVLQAREVAQGGLFAFSIHPWHLYVDCQGNQFSNNQVRKNLENLESIFSQIKQMQGIRILRQDKYMEAWLKEKDSS